MTKDRLKKIIKFLMIFIPVWIGLFSCRSSFIFHPKKEIYTSPLDVNLAYESIFFETQDQVKIHAWWIPSTQSEKTVLFCHGNAGNISYRLETIKLYHRLGVNCFIFDYRGYGRSQGEPTETGTYLDAEAAWNYLVKVKEIKAKNIILHGRSLGGSIAVFLATKVKPSFLIIESTFISIAEVAKVYSSCLPAGWFFGDSYPTYLYLKKIDSPLLIIHSQEDDFIPFAQGKDLYQLAQEPKSFLKIKGNHNEGFIFSMEIYEQALKTYIEKYLP